MSKKGSQSYFNVDYFKDLTGDIVGSEEKSVEEIGARVKKLRIDKGLTLEQLAKLTGFNAVFLTDIEANKVQPQLGTIIKLSKALDSAFGQLVSGKGNKLWLLAGGIPFPFCLILPYVIEPSVPTEQLQGKSPEYIKGYTKGYKDKAKGENIGLAFLGFSTVMILYFLSPYIAGVK